MTFKKFVRESDLSEDISLLAKEVSTYKDMPLLVKNHGTFLNVVFRVTLYIETLSKIFDGDVSSKQKLHAAVDLVDHIVKLPFFIDLVDGPILKILISFIVDLLNRKYGKIWGDNPKL